MLFRHGHELNTHLAEAAGAEMHTHVRDQLGGQGQEQRVTPMEPEMHLTHTEDNDSHHLAQRDDLNVNDLLNDEVNSHRFRHTQRLTHTQDSPSPLTHTHLTHPQDSASLLTHTHEPVGFGELQLQLKAEQEEEQVGQNLHKEGGERERERERVCV